MVRTMSLSSDWRVEVKGFKSDGSISIASKADLSPLDAFDYAVQAQGYFRFAIQEMQVWSISIDLIDGDGKAIESIEITKE